MPDPPTWNGLNSTCDLHHKTFEREKKKHLHDVPSGKDALAYKVWLNSAENFITQGLTSSRNSLRLLSALAKLSRHTQ